MRQSLSRRSFLKLGAVSLAGLAFRPYFDQVDETDTGDIARVTIASVSVYSHPSDKSAIVRQHYRDELVNIYYEVKSPEGPKYNPLWYRVWQGYMHSAYLQRVLIRANPVLSSVAKGGQLGEITVPFTQSMRYTKLDGWQPIYRLYYESIQWIMGIDQGPDGEPWYRLKDELLEIEYNVPAGHVRPIAPEELAPISPNVAWEKKRVEVSIQNQTLTAYENDQIVMHTKISSGIPGLAPGPKGIPSETPKGTFNVMSKMPSKHMGDGNITNDLEAYELPGVPWVTFFHENGVALHGTFWHNNFGTVMSHGCVNMRTAEAKWIFRWALPVSSPSDWERKGFGTTVMIA